jgi:hypothetical protein
VQTRIRLAACGALLAAGATVFAATAPAGASPTTRVVVHDYVNDNTTGRNTVAAFDRHADGSLMPRPPRPGGA